MILNELEPSMWTPELGGDFENLRLKLRYLPENEIREAHFEKKAYDSIGMMDINISGQVRVKLLIDVIQDWENMMDREGKPVVFEKEKHRADLKNFLLLKTGIPIPIKEGEKERKVERYYSLENYIEQFCMNRENFLKNSGGTAKNGCPGGSNGTPGKKMNS